jgi:hypothetical protein
MLASLASTAHMVLRHLGASPRRKTTEIATSRDTALASIMLTTLGIAALESLPKDSPITVTDRAMAPHILATEMDGTLIDRDLKAASFNQTNVNVPSNKEFSAMLANNLDTLPLIVTC